MTPSDLPTTDQPGPSGPADSHQIAPSHVPDSVTGTASVSELERQREPSWEWGWHGEFPRGSVIAGWATTAIFMAILVSRLTGTHTEGHVADVWLAVICAAMTLGLIRTMKRRGRSWRH